MPNSIRDNLLVTMGARAAYMDYIGDINIPGGLNGEDNLAKFVVETVDTYLKDLDSIGNFDEYIETALIFKYGKGE